MRKEGPDDHIKAKVSTSTLKRILVFFKGHEKAIILAILAVVLTTVLNAALPLVFREMVDNAIPSKDLNLVFKYASFYLVLLILFGVIQYFEMLIVGFMGIDIVNNIKNVMLKHMMTLSISFFDKLGSGRLISRIEADSQKLFMLFSSIGLSLLNGILNIFIAVSIMLATNVKLTMFVLAISPVYLLGTYLIFSKMRPMFRKERELYATIVNFLSEHIKAIPLLRNLNNLEWSKKKFHKMNEEKRWYEFRIYILEQSIWFVMMLCPQIVIALILYNSVDWIKEDIITIGTVWMFIQYIHLAIQPLIMISEQIRELQRAFGAADRIFEILDTEPEVKDSDKPVTDLNFSSKIEFKNVSFQYEPDKPVLIDLSLTIDKGTTVAIVGATGSGKTTIISLLSRFYDPDNGSIMIDGIDIKDIKQSTLRSKMSLVLQDIFLFPGNIMDNLRVLRNDISEEKVVDATKKMGIYNYLKNFPQSFNTELSEDGSNLSFGERQLLSFSRALTFDPEILIMDEATSSIDPYTEAEIQRSMSKLLKGRTSIIIAHRLSTIEHADKIIVLDQGKLVEQGTHHELMKIKGLYANLYWTQTGIE
ncbi:MAG: ABC transporter ATP-binding protein [Candidatus Delongbacteria bacterium]|jgi:ATP-binding cassette subfamily B multidrug efflux pump|nr:ABC transporter ATP-binding protein [Candidatus Delongbacteria bacterium]